MYRIVNVAVDEGTEYRCFSPADLAIQKGNPCIVEVDRVLEFGLVSGVEELEGEEKAGEGSPTVLRRATLQDNAQAKENALMSKMAADTCAKQSEKHGLSMRLVRVRYSFDRVMLRVLFTAEERVDFREMVKELATEFRTRVEMRQIGVRDEAAIVGGVGPCGRQLCCCTWLRHFEAVNVKMAKAQKLSLNPGAISGMCGRLKCCLRYEYEHYRELGRGLPRTGCMVECSHGRGCVVDKDILRQKLTLRLEDDRFLQCDADEVQRISGDRGRGRRDDDEDSPAQRSEPGPAGEA